MSDFIAPGYTTEEVTAAAQMLGEAMYEALEVPTLTMDELEEMDFAEPPKARWTITDDSMADWALRKIAKEREELDRIEALAKAEMDRINEKLERARKRYKNGSSFLQSELERYFNTVERKKQKTQETYQLLSGKLKRTFDKQEMKPDNEKLLNWLIRSGNVHLIKTTEEPRWGEIKKSLLIKGGKVIDKDSGEIVEGVEITVKPGSFSIDF